MGSATVAHLDRKGLDHLRRFVREHGHASVPRGYIAGRARFPLGVWLATLRENRRQGRIGQGDVLKLEALGVRWDGRLARFDHGLAHLERYVRANGHASIPVSYRDPSSGFPLGPWLGARRHEKRRGTLSAERVRTLSALGVVWDVFATDFDLVLKDLQAFVRDNGHANVPAPYRVPGSGFALGRWLNKLRSQQRRGTLAPHRVAALEQVGAIWSLHEANFDRGVRELAAFAAGAGHANPSATYRMPNSNFPIGRWLRKRREERKKGKLSAQRIAALNQLAVSWTVARGRQANARERSRAHRAATASASLTG